MIFRGRVKRKADKSNLICHGDRILWVEERTRGLSQDLCFNLCSWLGHNPWPHWTTVSLLSREALAQLGARSWAVNICAFVYSCVHGKAGPVKQSPDPIHLPSLLLDLWVVKAKFTFPSGMAISFRPSPSMTPLPPNPSHTLSLFPTAEEPWAPLIASCGGHYLVSIYYDLHFTLKMQRKGRSFTPVKWEQNLRCVLINAQSAVFQWRRPGFAFWPEFLKSWTSLWNHPCPLLPSDL